MSPIIDLQRRLVQVGRIRMGEKNEKGHPTRLTEWKLTSRDQVRLAEAAKVFGGTVQPWAARDGEYELHTETDALPILLMPGQTISQFYELWSGGGCKRRCDGETEQLTDGACLCDPEARECKPHTRLNVLLPDVPGIGCWRLDTSGWNAAVELAGTVDLLELATARGALLPARLRIDQRVQVKDGLTKKFPVPTLDIDVRPLEMVALTRGAVQGEIVTAELPTGYKPLKQIGNGVTVSEGLAAAERRAEPATRTARSAAPIGPEESFLSDDPVPVPTEDGDGTPAISAAQKKKLNVLVGKLREDGYLTTEHLWKGMGLDPELGRGEDGELHWSPLRESLSRSEASALIERLTALESKVQSHPEPEPQPEASAFKIPDGVTV